jgi:hypothetical protein
MTGDTVNMNEIFVVKYTSLSLEVTNHIVPYWTIANWKKWLKAV